MECATRSKDYLCLSIRTTCLWRRISETTRKIRASAAGTCPVSKYATPVDAIVQSNRQLIQVNSVGNYQSNCIFQLYATSTVELSRPTANQSPAGQYPSENICDAKSCWANCRPSRRSHERTV